MPQAIPALIAYFVNIGAYFAAAALFVAAVAYNASEQRRQRRNQRAAYEAGLRDRAVMVRSAELPRSLSYGETVTSGSIVYARSVGELQDRLLMVLALKPGHEITAIDEVWFGERSLGPLDVDGYPTVAPFAVDVNDVDNALETTAGGGATTSYTLATTPAAGTLRAFYDADSGDGRTGTYELTVASLTGASLTLNTVNASGSPLAAGYPVRITWRSSRRGIWLRCKRYLGTATQVADVDVIADSGGEWTAAHRGQGVPYLALWLYFSTDIYPTGLENIKARLRGKRVYDPRKDSTAGGSGSHRTNNPATWEYSRNPALCVRDYLTSDLGFECAHAEIDDALVIAAANVCDELVPLYNAGTVAVGPGANIVAGTGTNWQPWMVGQQFVGADGLGYTISEVTTPTQLVLATAYAGPNMSAGSSYAISQPRYRCDTELSTDNARDQNLNVLLSSMAGWAVWSQGQWRIYAGAYAAPSVTLTDADLADTGPIAVQSRVPRRDLFNAVKGVYVSPANNWQTTDYPPVRNSTYEAQDGERLVLDVPLPATTDPIMAQRLAKIELEESRQALTFQANFNLRNAYRLAPGDTVALTLARYGWSGKVFRVVEREFSLQQGVRLTLRETAAGVYDWALGEATTQDLAPNTALPDPFSVPSIGAVSLASGTVHLVLQADGSVTTRLFVSWPALADARVTQGGAIEVEWRDARKVTLWRSEPPLPGDADSAYVQPVEDGLLYQVRVRCRNGLGVRSEWTYSAWHQAVGKTEPPSNVSGLTSELTTNGILLKWDEASDIDYAATELRVGASWATGLIITRKAARTHLWGWQVAGALTVWAKHIDSSGNESAAAAALVVTVQPPGTPSLQAVVIANNVLLNWSDARTTQPIKQYRFRVGTTFAGASDLGSAGGDSRFETYFFSTPGAKRIWIQAEDIAGNLGTPTSVDVNVTNALGFKLRADFASTFAGTKTNALVQPDGSLLALVNTTESWGTHFSSRGWTTSADKIAAGFPIHAQPGTASASYQEVFDLGSTFTAATTLSCTFGLDWLAGGGTVAVQIDVSNTSATGPWTALAPGATVTTGVAFRWIRVTLTVTSDGGTNDLARLAGLSLRASQQKITESGTVSCVSTDAGGTTYTFTETFSGVASIQATPIGTSDRRAAVDFNYSTSNPTTCKVLLYDSAGARVTGQVALYIEGFQ